MRSILIVVTIGVTITVKASVDKAGSFHLSATKNSAATMLNGTIRLTNMLSQLNLTGDASTAQAGVGVDAPLDNGRSIGLAAHNVRATADNAGAEQPLMG